MGSIGKTMILMGALLIFVGFVVLLGGKLGLGRWPGDIYYKKGNVIFYFPLITSVVLSIVLSILFNLFFRR